MKSPTRFVEAKHRLVFIFSLFVISFIMMSCFYSGQDAAEAENRTPVANISNGLVMNGTATITYYFTKTCTNEGTAVLTVNPDSTFKLVANGPSVDDNCQQSGDRTNATFYGTVDVSNRVMNITSCMLDHQPVGEADGWITAVDAGGEAICYSVKPNGDRGTKYYYVAFDVKK
jgi:hypothetical protein